MSGLNPVKPETERPVLWQPPESFVARSYLTHFRNWLAAEHGLRFADYGALWQWSVDETEVFWRAVWDYFGVISSTPYRTVLSERGMPGARWFEGSLVNYAEHVLRHEAVAQPNKTAFFHATESRPVARISWQELGHKVRALATRLRALGVRPGDRIVSYMPNVPETAIAMLATTAIGAVWAAASPEFGARTVIDRFAQIEPRVVFAADGYEFGGKRFDRRGEMAEMLAALPSVERVVWLPNLGLETPVFSGLKLHLFQELLAEAGPGRDEFRFERVPHDHPLWVLFSSGTTGKPKAIVHSHVGIVAEHLKYMHLHANLTPDSCMFFYTTTGWMIWNSVISALMTGASSVLYDGSPMQGGPECLWRLAEETGTTLFGASPTLVQHMKAAGLKPQEHFDLSRLEAVILSGAPSSAETFEWFYENVKVELWVTSQSGGTELCSGLVGGVPVLPVRAGEIQGRMLGMDVHAWNEDAREVFGEPGELVVTSPFPSMPLFFWDDDGDRLYRDTYFADWPNVWRHGDIIEVSGDGGCFIHGRSDATLNRYGVRIGTAEIYSILEQVEGIADSLVVCAGSHVADQPMYLFVVLVQGCELDDRRQAVICAALRTQGSPRHVPDVIRQVPSIPYTLTGKKMEIPVHRILAGAAAASVASPDAMANPGALDWFEHFAARPEKV